MELFNSKLYLKGFDLFSGIGGFRTAAESKKVQERAVIDFVGYSEIDKYCVKTYEANYDTNNEYYIDDIEKVTKLKEDEALSDNDSGLIERLTKINYEIPDFDILFAGFPCQPYSLMGNRKGVQDERGELFYSIREVLRAKLPTFFILENVRAIKSVNEGKTFDYIKDCLENELGYKLSIFDLNSADFGVPQIRRRTFFIGVYHPKFKQDLEIPEIILENSRKYRTAWHLLEKEVDPKYFLSERIKPTILAHQKKGYNRKAEINRLIARPLTKTMHKMHRASQDNYYSLDFIQGEYNENINDVILTSFGSEKIRRITPLEAFRLQGFEDKFVENAKEAGVSDTQLYMQAGNAVTVNVVEQILFKLFDNFLADTKSNRDVEDRIYVRNNAD